ncbi:MAG TPA: AraC family transcriptional regulator [Chitinophagaceae bacterium]|nr:AraC family transcriptional regulator [Chitinophagaceae bacterium]
MVEIFDDIRKIYLFSQPCEELADYIEFFSESSDEATRDFTGNACFNVKMFPSWTPTFWINLGAPYCLTLGNERHYIPKGKDILVTRDSIAERHNQPLDHLFTIKFYPGGLETVLGIDQSSLAGKLVHLQDVLPASFIFRVKRAKNFSERQKLLEAFFVSQMRTSRPRAHYMELVSKTIATYTTGNLQYNVDEISARVFTTSKTINRYFNKVIGTTPKSYFSIIRSRTALTAYVTNRKGFDPSVFGYHDMSHFYKEAIKFTGERMAVHYR